LRAQFILFHKMPNLTFELFEAICDELRTESPCVLTEDIFSAGQLEELQLYYGETTPEGAFAKALKWLEAHFSAKGSRLPFGYDPRSWTFWQQDQKFIEFLTSACSIRGRPLPDAKRFETAVCKRLEGKLTGHLHCVGWPRNTKTKVAEFNAYLEQLGFEENALEAQDKDGGFDIIWLPPLGAVPIRPLVSLQCKNSSFDRDEAYKSVGQAMRSFERHSHMSGPANYLCCVVFNDYIDESYKGKARGWNFVPLGLSDLSGLVTGIQAEYL